MNVFETTRLIVRQYTRDDAANSWLINGDEDIVRFIRPVMTETENSIFLEKNLLLYSEQPGVGRWGVIEKSTGSFAGSFAIIPLANTVEFQLGYALLKPLWGKGFATEFTIAGIAYGFEKLKLQRIVAITRQANIPSQQVLKKAGFNYAGLHHEDGEDNSMFEIIRN